MTTIARSGSFVVERPYDAVAGLLADPERVARCLPDTVESVRRDDEGVSAVVVTGTPAANIRLRLHLRRTRADVEAGRVAYDGHGSAARSRVDLRGTFRLEAVDAGVRVDWEGEATVGGLLASLGSNAGRYDGIVERKIDAAIENVRTAVET